MPATRHLDGNGSRVQGAKAPPLPAVHDELVRRDFTAEVPDTLWVAGGGVHNGALMDALQDALAARDSACKVVPSGDAGVDPDGREGLIFAVLAARWVMGQGVARPQASGAALGRVLGKLSPGALPPR